MSIVEFEIPMFYEKILVCISPNMDEIKAMFPKDKLPTIEGYDGSAFNATHKDGKGRRIIWVSRWNVPIFIHEAYHTVYAIMDYRGIDDTETGAYMMEYIYEQTVKGRTKNQKKSRIKRTK